MAGYIGTTPVPQATQHRESFTATGGQTSFATAGYTPQFIDVYLNGVKLAPADYTATNGSDVVLASGATASDILEIVAYTPFEVANQTFTGTTTAANLTVTGAFTSQGIDDNADATAITIDSSENVGIGTTSPSTNLHVSSSSNGATAIIEAQGAYNARVRILSGNANSSFLEFADPDDSDVGEIVYDHSNNSMRFNTNASEAMRISSDGSVAINDSSPDGKLNVVSTAHNNGSIFDSTGTTQLWLRDTDAASNQKNWGFQVSGGSLNILRANDDRASGFVTPIEIKQAPANSLVIDASGNVGIGNSTPSNNHANANNLVVGNGTAGGIANYVGTGLGWYAFSRANANNSDAFDGGISYDGSRNLMFHTNAGSERMRLDASGNLLVGKTSANATDVGIVANANGRLYAAASGASSIFNRTSSDGDIVDFRKDGSTVGSIGIQSTGFYIDGESGHAGIRFAGNEVSPRDNGSDADGVVSLGESDKRFKDLYLSGGVYLGGTGSANQLDDYEEGTWTATLEGTTTNPSTSVTTTARYTKVGRLVTVTVTFSGVNTTGAAGAVRVSGLPFTAYSGQNGRAHGSVMMTGMPISASNNFVVSRAQNGNTYIEFFESGDNTSTSAMVHSAGTGKYLATTISYEVA